DHLVGAQQDRCRQCHPDRACSLEVDRELKMDGLLDRQVGWLGASQNFGGERSGSARQWDQIDAVRHQPTPLDVFLSIKIAGSRYSMASLVISGRCRPNDGLDSTISICTRSCARARNAATKSYGGFSILIARNSSCRSFASRSAEANWSADWTSHSAPSFLRSGNASISNSICLAVSSN